MKEDNAQGVKTVLQTLEIVPQSKIMLGFFDLNAEGKKNKISKAWKLFKVGVGQKYKLDEFEAFMSAHGDLLPEEVIERLKVIGKRGVSLTVSSYGKQSN
ncbi:hypothetical protein SUGI_1009550 [Cryptomeria japonica]|nr:hypothetical protein SUGI_1009550 [Cryptomeria japonica]